MLSRFLPALILWLSSAYADPNFVTVSPRVSDEQLILSDHPADTKLSAYGVILLGGKSEHFNPPPSYTVLKGSGWDPENGVGYPDTSTLEAIELPNQERYPLQVRDMESPHLEGAAVIGLQSKLLPWRVVKAMWDGDAVHIKNCTGTASVSDVYFENVEDGLGPSDGLDYWKLERAWMKDIRDDTVENDSYISGEITNCLIDGCFVFLSTRDSSENTTPPRTIVKDCLVRISAQPHDGTEGRSFRNRYIKPREDGVGVAPGMIFKWERNAGEVEVRDTIFYMDAVSINGVDDMIFPPGTYENVTLIWTGPGNYPGRLPQGITVIRDPSVWEKARGDWISKLPLEHPGLNLPDLP